MHMTRNDKRRHRTRRIRAKVSGNALRPRMSIFRSLQDFSAQLIDDEAGKTLIAGQVSGIKAQKNTVDGAAALGKEVARKCKDKKIDNIVFDRGGYKYHGKVRAFAEALREGGIKF
jgi:large subunit ribosomal protein L18